MFFKLTNRNAYRDFVRNARRIALSSDSYQTKFEAYRQLYTLLSPRMLENERLLNASPAFAKRCEFWNSTDISSIKAVTTLRNPWLLFKREFENAMQDGAYWGTDSISRSLGWFYATDHRDDWICD
jgi:type II restriction/modification system DNA methylase subunit YeeA